MSSIDSSCQIESDDEPPPRLSVVSHIAPVAGKTGAHQRPTRIGKPTSKGLLLVPDIVNPSTKPKRRAKQRKPVSCVIGDMAALQLPPPAISSSVLGETRSLSSSTAHQPGSQSHVLASITKTKKPWVKIDVYFPIACLQTRTVRDQKQVRVLLVCVPIIRTPSTVHMTDLCCRVSSRSSFSGKMGTLVCRRRTLPLRRSFNGTRVVFCLSNMHRPGSRGVPSWRKTSPKTIHWIRHPLHRRNHPLTHHHWRVLRKSGRT